MWTTINILGLIIDLVIFIVAFWAYSRTEHKTALYMGIAFFLFWIYYLIDFIGYNTSLGNYLLILRTIAYLLVVFAVYTLGRKKK